MTDLGLTNPGRGQDRAAGVPEASRAGSVSVVDHLLETGEMKVLVPAGGFLCVVPLIRGFGYGLRGFARN